MSIDHVVKASRLIELLQTLPEGSQVVPNRVMNLLVLNAEGDYVGIVDFNHEQVDMFSDQEDEG